MTSEIRLRMHVGEFVLAVRRLTLFVERHGDRLTKATNGKISARIASEMNRLADRLAEIEVRRLRIAPGSARSVVRDAEKLITAIGSAARYAGSTHPLILEQLERVRTGKQRRAAAAVKFSLEMHLELVRAHSALIGDLLPASLERDATELIARLRAHDEALERATMTREAVTEERNAIIAELKRIMSDVRALATVLGRTDPDFLRDFERTADTPAKVRRRRSRATDGSGADPA